jgi:MFS family permease
VTTIHRPTGLWRHPGFVKLWAAQTVSAFGDQVTVLALPLLAVTTLGAGAGQMGVLRAAETGPILVVGLFAGVWVDRLRRRPILIAADLGRAALLLAIPLAAWLDVLRIELLYAVGILVGTLTVFFDVARQSYVTAVVGRGQLVDANSKLAVSASGAEVVGPGLAGGLVQLLGAPATVLLDALSFAVSGALIGRIRNPEPAPAVRPDRPNVWREIRAGLHLVACNPILRTLAGATGSGNVFENARYAVLVLYMTDDLGLSPGAIGLVLAAGSVGYFLGAFLPARTARRFGLGRAIVGAMSVFWFSELLYPFAAGPPAVAVPLLIAALFLGGLASPSYDVNQFSLRQAITPDHLLGRVNASMRVLIRGAVPIGALLGGLIGELFGLRAVMVFGALGGLSSLLWLWRSPIPSLQSVPPHPLGVRR